MTVIDDLKKLAELDVVYLRRRFFGEPSPEEVYRGRVHQALDGNWVFNASTGQNGIVGFDLGSATTGIGIWNSAETPTEGITVTVDFESPPSPQGGPGPSQTIVLASLIPPDFAN